MKTPENMVKQTVWEITHPLSMLFPYGEKQTTGKIILFHMLKYEGRPKNFRNCYKNLFQLIIQVWKFSTLQSSTPVTGCSDPCNAPTAGNIV